MHSNLAETDARCGHLRTDSAPAAFVFSAIVLAILALIAPSNAQQCEPRWYGRSGIPGVDGTVSAMVRLPDGELIVGGDFQIAGSVRAINLARYRPTSDEFIPIPAPNGPIRAMTLLPGGDVVLGGDFTYYQSLECSHIARVNPVTGVFAPLASGVDGAVNAQLALSDGSVLVAGEFQIAGGLTSPHIAIYHPDSNTWEALGSGTNDVVHTMAFDGDGSVLIGGDFTMIGESPCNFLARYRIGSGALVPFGVAPPNHVRELVVRQDSSIVTGAYSGASMYSPLTNQWSSVPSLNPAAVSALLALPDGGLLVASAASGTNPYTYGFVRRIDAGNQRVGEDVAYRPADIVTFLLTPDGRIYAGGGFNAELGAAPASGIAYYDLADSSWHSMGSGSSGPVQAMVPLQNGDMLAGGCFQSIEGYSTGSLARFVATTNSWDSVEMPSGCCYCILPVAENRAVVGGDFAFLDHTGTLARNIAIVDLETRVWESMGPGFNQPVRALTQLANGTIVAGGEFTRSGSTVARRVAQFDSSSGSWMPVGAGFDGSVFALRALPGGDIVAAGQFLHSGSTQTRFFAHYQHTAGTWTAPPLQPSNKGNALCLLNNGDVLLGTDNFQFPSGFTRLARYRPDTQGWSPLPTPPCIPTSIVLRDDGTIVVGGSVGTGGNIATLDPIEGNWHQLTRTLLDQPCDRPVRSVAIAASGTVFVGGDFGFVENRLSAHIARWAPNAAPAIVDQPDAVLLCESSAAVVSIHAADPTGAAQYSWQIELAPEFWTTVSELDIPLRCGGFASFSDPNARMTLVSVSRCTETATTGRYRVRCVVSNSCGSQVSEPADLIACGTEFDCIPGITSADLFSFLDAWFGQFGTHHATTADFDASGEVTVSDLFAYLEAWFAESGVCGV